MVHAEIEALSNWVSGARRAELVDLLRSLDCDFPLDFTDDFLAAMSVERLRHVCLAAAMRARHLPDPAGLAAG